MKFIENFLDKITMYRLMLYYLGVLACIAIMGSFFGAVTFSPVSLIISLLFLIIISAATNNIFSYVFKAKTNFESVYITALILFLIIPPVSNVSDFILVGWAGILAQSLKYIIAVNKKHIFNPVAIAVVITGLILNQTVSWWVGSAFMNPFIFIGGILILLKVKRVELIISFVLTGILTSAGFSLLGKGDYGVFLKQIFLDSPLLFFAFVMITEPQTMPPTKKLQIFYGAIVGFLFTPQIHFFSIYSTPELALVLGNIFSYLVSPKGKMLLSLKEKIQIAPGIYNFVFTPVGKLNFLPGQYLEWTLNHKHPDNRGSRRYFTIASSPTEEDIAIGIKFYQKSSSYKMALYGMSTGDEIMAGGLAGDFVLPRDPNIKLVFIAGGIGITPFRSMIKDLIDTKQKRSVTLLYASTTPSEIVYEEVFNLARNELGIKTVYCVDDISNFPNWSGRVGHIDEKVIMEEVPDYKERAFYISGPPSMVSAFKGILTKMGVPGGRIKTDYFPGFA